MVQNVLLCASHTGFLYAHDCAVCEYPRVAISTRHGSAVLFSPSAPSSPSLPMSCTPSLAFATPAPSPTHPQGLSSAWQDLFLEGVIRLLDQGRQDIKTVATGRGLLVRGEGLPPAGGSGSTVQRWSCRRPQRTSNIGRGARECPMLGGPMCEHQYFWGRYQPKRGPEEPTFLALKLSEV